MEIFKLDSMTKGWFIGNFEPTAYKTEQCEVAVKHYNAGEIDDEHVHKLCDEITLIVKGKVQMNNAQFTDGDIILIRKNEPCKFKALEKSITVVVKSSSIKHDKYIINI